MKKKLLLVLITAILALSVIVLVGCGNSDIPATEGLKYEKIDGKNEYMLSSMDMATDTNIVIASTYEGMPVTAIGEWAFSGCSDIESITIPNSVTSIGNYAFSGCSNLKRVTIGNSVTSIGNSAFYNCNSLTKVNYTGKIANWVQIDFGDVKANPLYYAKNLYINNTLLTNANITSATKINTYAFSGCSSLTSITIGNKVTSIGEFAFSDCNSLVKVNYIGTIDDWVQIEFLYSPMFGGFTANPLCYAGNLYVNGMLVTNANITSANKINAYAFYGCSSIESITIGGSVTSIGDYAFNRCSNLERATIGDNVTSIGSRSFYSCSSLGSITIPSSVTSIGNYAFADCTSLTIYCEATSKPSGWNSDWNYSNRPVVWDYKNN